MDELFFNNFLQCTSSTNRLFFASRYVRLLFPVISFLTHVVHGAIFTGKKNPAPSLFATSRVATSPVAVLWAGMEICIGLESPGLGSNIITFIFPFLQVLLVSFPNLFLQYHVL